MLIGDVFRYLMRQAKYAILIAFNPKIYNYEGVSLPLRATPELQKIRRAVYRGEYERPEIEAIRHLIRPDDIVLELGSGCGMVSAFIARHLSDSRNLYTVEPNPRLLESIRSVATANDLAFNVIHSSVGSIDGEQAFFFDEDFLSSSSIDRNRGATKTMVQVVALPTLLEKIRPTFIVFDIEGVEHEVFRFPIPRQVRVLCGELHPHIVGDHAISELICNIINQDFDLLIDSSRERAVAFLRDSNRFSSSAGPSCSNTAGVA